MITITIEIILKDIHMSKGLIKYKNIFGWLNLDMFISLFQRIKI